MATKDMKQRIQEIYLNGTIRQALEKGWLGETEIDAILEMIRHGIR